MLDVEKLMDGVHKWFVRETKPIIQRLKALEERQPEKGEPGAPGVAGEKGLDGEPGKTGEQGPQGEKGLDGEPGPRGEAGKEGPQGLTGKQGERGEPGPAGVQGEKGLPGDRGEKGEPGRDGKSIELADVEPVLETAVAKWALEFERRAQDTLQKAVDKIPTPKDGVDGLGFDSLEVYQPDPRTVVLCFESGERKKEFSLEFPVVLDQGVYKSGEKYSKGDGVTYGGSFWIAQVKCPNQKPGSGQEWRLSVKNQGG